MNFCNTFIFSLFAYTCLFFSSKTFGQGKFLNGYIVSPVNDTIKGFIRYEHWDVSPTQIDFKENLETGTVQKVGKDRVSEFSITSVNETYKNRKIGIINIDPTYEYVGVPSLQATDSISVFLRVVTKGKAASLLAYKNSRGGAHYFLERNNVLTELLNYPYRGIIRGRIYLLVYDEYKNQLPTLLADSDSFNEPIPKYSEKSLRMYVEKYNESRGEVRHGDIKRESDDLTVDLFLGGGVESWKEPGIHLDKKLTFGMGLRINLPRKAYNRYLKAGLFFIPNVSTKEVYKSFRDEKRDLKTIEFGTGTHFGFGKLRPFAGVDLSIGLNDWRSIMIGPHLGLSLDRKLSLEVSHFADLGSLFSPAPFFNGPRISLNYYLNLNKLFSRN